MNFDRILRQTAYSIAKKIDCLTNPQVNESVKIINFGETANLDAITEFRLQALKKLIQYASINVPYYRDLFAKIGLDSGSIENLQDLEKIPVLTKDDIRLAGTSLQSLEIKKILYSSARSGGTTGEPITSYLNRKAQALGTYASFRGFNWMGWKPGIPVVTLFGGSLGRPNITSLRVRTREFALGNIFLPAFELTKNNVAKYLETIDQYAPCIVKGYASVLYTLALYAEEVKYIPRSIISFFSTAEYLPDQWAMKISDMFGCPVKCYYGCGEINSLGFQVDPFGPYIVPDEHVIIESFSEGSTNEEKTHSLFVTSLFNYAQPLIRYKLGDLGKVNLPGTLHPTRSTITNLIGRTSDMIIRKDGSVVSPSLAPHLVLKTKLPVRKYQIIQKDLINFHFLYDPEHEDLTENEKTSVTEILKDHISSEIVITFIKTTDFLLSRTGKLSIVISELS